MKKAFPAVFDPEPKVKEMASTISFFGPDTEEGEAIVPDVPIPTGSFDGCPFRQLRKPHGDLLSRSFRGWQTSGLKSQSSRPQK